MSARAQALGLLAAGCALLAACAGVPPVVTQRDERAHAAHAAFARGTALLERGDMLRAEQYLLLAIRRGHPEAEALPGLVRSCVASSRLRAALAHALPYLKRHPEAWQLRYLVAAIQLALGRPAVALAELRTVLETARDAAGPSYLAGVIERDQFQNEQNARERFAAYLRARPEGEHAAEVRAWLSQRRPQAEQP